MAEVLKGRKPFLETRGGFTDMVLLGAFFKVEGFHLRAYNEFEAYFDEPEPYLEINLSSAAVFARIVNNSSILLVEFEAEKGERRVELPAGKVDDSKDKTIFDTATREFTEETGGVMTLPYLRPFAVSYHKNGKGGLQFYTEIPELRVGQTDELGRGYLTPPDGTDRGKVVQLITEPLGVFLDPEKTLLRYSQNKWAVDEITRMTLGMHTMKLDENKNRTLR